MFEATSHQELRRYIQAWKNDGKTIALVPTMGNLHAGHLALVNAARGAADRVVTSIYVNPTQFSVNEDLASYPRTPSADRESLLTANCDLLFTPDNQTIYPNGIAAACMLSAPVALASVLEGESRPGHFDGVVTVVSRLFNLVNPDIAIFGEKDFQQLLIIQHMVKDLHYAVDIKALPTVREDNGLALSSRNRYLDEQQKIASQNLSSVLQDTAARASKPRADFRSLEKEAEKRLESCQLRADYVAIRRACDLGIPRKEDSKLRILAAVWCGKTRLIDNLNINCTCNHSD